MFLGQLKKFCPNKKIKAFYSEMMVRAFAKSQIPDRLVVFSVPIKFRSDRFRPFSIRDDIESQIINLLRSLSYKDYLIVEVAAKGKSPLAEACKGIVDFVSFCMSRRIPQWLDPPDWIPRRSIIHPPIASMLALIAAYYPYKFIIRITHIKGHNIYLEREPFTKNWSLTCKDYKFELPKDLSWGRVRFAYCVQLNSNKVTITLLLKTPKPDKYVIVIMTSNGRHLHVWNQSIVLNPEYYQKLINPYQHIGPFIFDEKGEYINTAHLSESYAIPDKINGEIKAINIFGEKASFTSVSLEGD